MMGRTKVALLLMSCNIDLEDSVSQPSAKRQPGSNWRTFEHNGASERVSECKLATFHARCIRKGLRSAHAKARKLQTHRLILPTVDRCTFCGQV